MLINLKYASSIIILVFLFACKPKPEKKAEDKIVLEKHEAGTHLKIEYDDDYPTVETLEQMHEDLLFQSAVQIALWAQPLVATYTAHKAMKNAGIENTTIAIAEDRATSDQIIATANQETVYAYGFTNIKEGPMVFVIAPNCIGFIADAWQRPIEDLGLTGPDNGQGGKYIIIPPNYEGKIPKTEKGTFIYHSSTNLVWWVQRVIVKAGEEELAVESIKEHAKIYRYAHRNKDVKQKFVNQSKIAYNAMPDYKGMMYWHLIDDAIQSEPIAERDLSMMGLAKTMGIEKGKHFASIKEEKEVLERAAFTAKAMMISLGFDSKIEGIKTYKGRQWENVFQTTSPYFEGENGVVQVHERASFTYQALTGAKSMVEQYVGKGSQYQLAAKDTKGLFLNGKNTYKLHVLPDVPVENYWSVCVYDVDNRSLTRNGTPKSSTGSHLDIEYNEDGSADLYFGPKKPENVKEENYVKTKKGGWFTYFRFYGPKREYFNKSWKLEDLEKVE